MTSKTSCCCDPCVAIATVNLIIIGLGLASYIYSKIENSENTTHTTTRNPEMLTFEAITHNVSGEISNFTQSQAIDL